MSSEWASQVEPVAKNPPASAEVKGRREVAQSCPTLCDPTDCRLPGSSVHGIFQARVLEWTAVQETQEMQVRSWVGEIPWRRAQQPGPVHFPGASHGWRSLTGYSPRGHKESDTTERLSTARRVEKTLRAEQPSPETRPSDIGMLCPSAAWLAYPRNLKAKKE